MTIKQEQPRFYGRRKGRPIRKYGSDLLETLLPRIRIDLPGTGQLNVRSLAGNKPIWLEIGFGGGEHLAALATANPDHLFIGCEPFVNGVSSLLQHIDQNDLQNIRLFPEDARLLLNKLPDACLDKVCVMFADPWPKKRHIERRFIGADNLKTLARVMKPGAELRVATDDPTLQAWSHHCLRCSADFAAHPETSDGQWANKPVGWPATRYETKALAQGRQPIYFSYLRK